MDDPLRSSSPAADPQVYANHYIVEVDHPEWGPTKMIRSPISLSDTPSRWGTAVPELGQHTEEILLEVGFDWDEIDSLRGEAAI
jgi:crotonobetainyl-CoA:carnitine CoA-transferase CaiB-like acyl-CoA transferase